ncbi:MAG: hypothetical protein Barrevirus13_11 [Barrevirus sp.]|uniref:Uncharacterized protein n=1 Tax=Barrevirus sp. TaxID=2487763 RepID=A0A3G4ZQE0_9VIRU|nr:MAG: hypothetical protein Barrevirus13_11 [Barrevirus sp.]
MGNSCNIFLRKKCIDEDDIEYYSVPKYVGKDINHVYTILSKKYKNYKIFIISNDIVARLIDKWQTIFIYSDSCNNCVVEVKIYD